MIYGRSSCLRMESAVLAEAIARSEEHRTAKHHGNKTVLLRLKASISNGKLA